MVNFNNLSNKMQFDLLTFKADEMPQVKILTNYYTAVAQSHKNQTQISTVKQAITQRNRFLSQWACCVCPCMCAQAQARICSRSVSSDPHRILKLSILITFLHNFAHSPLTTLAYAISFWGRIKSELASTFFNQRRSDPQKAVVRDIKNRPCDIGKVNREVEDTALGPDQQVQVFGPMVGHGLHEGGDGGEEGLHVERGVERHNIRNQTGKTLSFQMMKKKKHQQTKPQNVTIAITIMLLN